MAVAALGGAGCASWSASRARDKILAAEVGGHLYREQADQLWPEVRRLLADKGLSLGGKDAELMGQDVNVFQRLTSVAKETESTPTGGLRLETNWTTGGRRWRAEAQPDAGGCRVKLTKIIEHENEHGHDGASMRDLSMELELLRRIDPVAAERIDDLVDPPGPGETARRPPAPPPAEAPPPPPKSVPSIRVE